VPFLDREGVRIAYDVTGSGPTLLFTHGFGASKQMFAASARSLSRDRRVVTWDLRGHGDSDYPPNSAAYSVPIVVDDMIAILDALGAERAVLAGHSLGGFVSLELATAQPERVAALVLIGTGPGYRSDVSRAEWNQMVEQYAHRLDTRGLAGLRGSEELNSGAHRDASGLILAARGILAQHDARVIDSLGSLGVPALIVVGDRDEQFLAGSRYLAAKLPKAELVVVPDAGHAPNLSQPTLFDQHVLTFLDRVEAG
jgi:pimeloyl-ACP methyl ester carboxylesterase